MDQLEARQFPAQVFARKLKSDDDNLLAMLYTDNYAHLERYVLKNGGTGDEAKDVYQEAFTAVWRNIQLDRFSPATEAEFGAYLIRVAKNKWIDELRRNKNIRMVSVDEKHEADIVAQNDGNETDTYIDAVKKQYRHLGARCRELLGRFYFHKQSLREIAEAFDWTEPSAKNNKYRCLKQLRELVLGKGMK